jgi:hypothetical protein
VCIQAVDVNATATDFAGDSSVEEVGRGLTDVALIDVASHPLWAPAGYADAAPVVDIGCPSPPLPLQMDTDWINGRSDGPLGLPRVDQPSYDIFVFVVESEEKIDRMLGGLSRRTVSQEFVCDTPDAHSSCWEVSAGVYVTQAELQDERYLAQLLTEASGLARRS